MQSGTKWQLDGTLAGSPGRHRGLDVRGEGPDEGRHPSEERPAEQEIEDEDGRTISMVARKSDDCGEEVDSEPSTGGENQAEQRDAAKAHGALYTIGVVGAMRASGLSGARDQGPQIRGFPYEV
jgi:hypothetical protein